MSDHDIDFYAYKLPIMGLLAANTFFLVWIMVVSSHWSAALRTLCSDWLILDSDFQAEVSDPHHGPRQETLQGGQGKVPV